MIDLPPTPTFWPLPRQILRAWPHPMCAPFLAVDTLASSRLSRYSFLRPSSPPKGGRLNPRFFQESFLQVKV